MKQPRAPHTGCNIAWNLNPDPNPQALFFFLPIFRSIFPGEMIDIVISTGSWADKEQKFSGSLNPKPQMGGCQNYGPFLGTLNMGSKKSP